MNSPKHRASTLRRTVRRFAAASLTALVLATGLYGAAPATALEGPQAYEDEWWETFPYQTTPPTSISGNFLENDFWDPEHTATVTSVVFTEPTGAHADYPGLPGFSLDWRPDGSFTATWDTYDDPQIAVPMRVVYGHYTLTDSAGQSSRAPFHFVVSQGERPYVPPPTPDLPLTLEDEVGLGKEYYFTDEWYEPCGDPLDPQRLCIRTAHRDETAVPVGSSGIVTLTTLDGPNDPGSSFMKGALQGAPATQWDRDGLYYEITQQPADGRVIVEPFKVISRADGTTGEEVDPNGPGILQRSKPARLHFEPTAKPAPGDFLKSEGALDRGEKWTDVAGSTSFEYRVCSSVSGECSNTARVGFDYLHHHVWTAWHKTAPGSEFVPERAGTAFTFDPQEEFLRSGTDGATGGEGIPFPDASALSEAEMVVVESQTSPQLGASVTGGKITVASLPQPGEYGAVVVAWTDATGVTLAMLIADFWTMAPPPPAVSVAPDEWWAEVGQSIGIYPFLNDGAPQRAVRWGDLREFPEAPEDWRQPYALHTRPVLGTTGGREHTDGWVRRRGIHRDDALGYTAGSVPGTEVLDYRLCHGHPTDAGCSETSQITIHVTPEVAAVNDTAATEPGAPVTVPVLANDVFNDVMSDSEWAPTMKRAEVSLVEGSLPDDVEAVVHSDRTVTVTAPEAYAGKSVSGEYRLRDFTGTSTARFTVEVGAQPEPVVPPKARDDKASSVHGVPVDVRVLANDQFKGEGKVRVIEGSVPKGVKAKVNDRGIVTLTAPKRLAGESYSLQYRLTDRTGKSDTATIRVKVAPDLVIVTGADRIPHPRTGELVERKPAEATDADDSTAAAWVIGGVAALTLLGVAAGIGVARRRSEP